MTSFPSSVTFTVADVASTAQLLVDELDDERSRQLFMQWTGHIRDDDRPVDVLWTMAQVLASSLPPSEHPGAVVMIQTFLAMLTLATRGLEMRRPGGSLH